MASREAETVPDLAAPDDVDALDGEPPAEAPTGVEPLVEERQGEEPAPGLLTRRRLIVAVAGVSAAAAAAAGGVYLTRRAAPVAPATIPLVRRPLPTGYAPDGTAGRTAAFPLDHVELDSSVFSANQGRNTNYLHFLDPDRMLHTFRLNYGLADTALPPGGWEHPGSEVRGHTTGHLLSGLAITYANTGDERARSKAEYLVGQLAALQQRATKAGFHPGYLSAFPEYFFDWLESGRGVWSPYYMIHKYLAGMIDAYQLAGVSSALDVAINLADWVYWRTGRLSYAQMQDVLKVEYGGLPESLANLYTITGDEKYLVTAGRFYHAAFYDPLAAGIDNLSGLHANTNTPKIIAALRMWEETGDTIYQDIAENFWNIVLDHHMYVIGGSSNHEHWQDPDQVSTELSNYTCEGCVTYNLLKLARLLHFHNQSDTAYLDYYERALFNHMLGTQDPTSPHGFNCYYMGLSPDAFKQQPLNYFPTGNPDIYATDYETFTCDNATGLETQAKFADTIYSRDARGIYVNLFIPSRVRCADQGITLRQTTTFPAEPGTTLTVAEGSAAMELRVRVPAWIAAAPSVRLNGQPITGIVRGPWITVARYWQPGDELQVTLPMTVNLTPTPDNAQVQSVSYGPTVLAGAYGSSASPTMPTLTEATVSTADPVRPVFSAVADGKTVALLPVASINHQHFTVYWKTA
ncbi:MAG: glycoside hydrolase family 127 protein [Streptosporangiaceae bacterium]|jgi:DUF1680 family protein